LSRPYCHKFGSELLLGFLQYLLSLINSYKNTIPVKRKLKVWKEIEEPERHISPLGKHASANRRYENNRKYQC
jgi:hypothetical protein